MQNIFILAAILDFRFLKKQNQNEKAQRLNFIICPMEKLCTKFGAFVRPVNIMLKNDAIRNLTILT